MNNGDLRNKIMDKCPDAFESDLKEWINELEEYICSVRDKLDINSINDLDEITDAKSDLDDICNGLY